MTCTWVLNGVMKLIICPDNELEKTLLDKLMREKVEITAHPTLAVVDKQIQDSIVIMPIQSKEQAK